MISESSLPKIRGKYRFNSDLSKSNWFRVGGKAEVLFRPKDLNDLIYFLKNKPANVEINVIAVGSNLIVSDAGISGIVIKLGREFAGIIINKNGDIEVGAGALDVNLARFCANESIGGLEFLSGIPGTIGGALAMNAGAYGTEIKDILISAQAVDLEGNIHELTAQGMGFSYRKNSIDKTWIFTRATLKVTAASRAEIEEKMREIEKNRQASQPIRTRTGGSTFCNPDSKISGGKKAWQLIDEAGCRGLEIGGAKVSQLHCNFLENTGNATASDLLNLAEDVRRRVKEKSGIELKLEIKFLGD